MSNINLNIQELQCEDPIFTNVVYTGTPYNFELSWTSQGSYLSTFDSTVTIYIKIEMFSPGQTTPYFSGYVSTPPPLPFDGVNYHINVLDYDNLFSGKDRLVFTLTLAGEASCNTEVSYEFPEDSLPN